MKDSNPQAFTAAVFKTGALPIRLILLCSWKGRTRTYDLLLNRELLYQLSYYPIWVRWDSNRRTPKRADLQSACFGQLAYTPENVFEENVGVGPTSRTAYAVAVHHDTKVPVVERIGIEPMTPCVQSRCSSQLS